MTHNGKAGKPVVPGAQPEAALNALLSRAHALHQQGNYAAAAGLYQQILEHDPAHADALHLLGVLAHQTGNTEAAVSLLEQSLAQNPKQGQVHYNLASMQQSQGRPEAAIRHYRLCLKYLPAHVDANSNLGVLYQDQGKLAQARQCYQQALRHNPDSPLALQNLGTLHNNAGRYREAESCFRRLLQRHPMLAEANDKLAQLCLLQGDFTAGWQGYRWRTLNPAFLERNPVRLLPFPCWSGESLHGKSILVQADLGVGDVVMFLSCLPDLLEQAKRVVLQCPPRFVTLLARSFPGLELLPGTGERDFVWHARYGHFDYQTSLSALPVFTRPSPADFPAHQGYLKPDPRQVADWRLKLDALGPELKVGISWRGGADTRAQQARSLPLASWQALASLPGIRLVSLQYGDHKEEAAQFNRSAQTPLHCFDELDAIADLEGFSALLAAVDLVISIDNSTVHFAGALDVPVWVLLPLTPDWRWMLQREDSPWYPSARLFRADAPGGEALLKPLRTARKRLQEMVGHDAAEPVSESGVPEASATAGILEPFDWRAGGYALLLNDTTAWYHWGCSCTSLAIHDQLRARFDAVLSVPISDTRELQLWPQSAEQFDDDALFHAFREQYPVLVDKLERAQAVVINGEGTLHRLNRTSLGLLYLAYIAAVRLGRRVSVINHSCYPDGTERREGAEAYALYRKVYRELAYVAVREQVSRRELDLMEVDSVQSFDSLPLYLEKHYNPPPSGAAGDYIVLGASAGWTPEVLQQIAVFIGEMHASKLKVVLLVGARANPGNEDTAFVQALAPLIGKACELRVAWTETEWLRTIAQAGMLVSGRFHHSIAAAFLGTPLLLMGSNTPKIEGLLGMLELDAFIDEAQPGLGMKLAEQVRGRLASGSPLGLAEERRSRLLALAAENYRLPD